MTDPMTPERLTALHRRYDGLSPDAYAADHPTSHVGELLAYVDELQAHLRRQAADELTRMDAAMEIEAAVHAARHVALAERNEARDIARELLTVIVMTAPGRRVTFSDCDALPAWLTATPPEAGTATHAIPATTINEED